MKEHLQGVSIASRIRMMRAAHAGSFLLVEGEDDKKLFQQLIDQAACRVQIAYGKPNLLAALEILERDGFQGLLAIADADFDWLDDRVPHSPNLLWTDTHDIETMLLRSPAFERVLTELGEDTKLSASRATHGEDLRACLLACGVPIGFLRWLSARDQMGLLFEELPVEKILVRGALVVDRHALLNVLQGRSRKSVLDAADIWSRVATLEGLAPSPWLLCCGHDLVRLLSHALCRHFGSNKESDVTPARLEKDLRLAYDRADFERTALCVAILRWEEAHPPFAILPRSQDLSPAP